jgi:hypothetical protein
MKAWHLLCFLALAVVSGGCSWVHYSTQNLIDAPVQCIHHCQELHRFKALAEVAWNNIREADPERCYSEDYADGFICGYVDFLDADGNGEPPAAPPRRYLAPRYHQTPAGLQAIDDWFAGFRHGAATARESGQRQLIVLPLALPPRQTTSGMETPLGGPAPAEELPMPQRQRRIQSTTRASAPSAPVLQLSFEEDGQ